MSTSTTIKLYLVDGQPDELRTAEISSWSGKAIAGSRKNLADLRAREELAGPGIYFFIGEDDKLTVSKVYSKFGGCHCSRRSIKWTGLLEESFWSGTERLGVAR